MIMMLPPTKLAFGLSTSPEGRGKRSAFSLVELSIVLVILGLLVGGVLSGQSLIRASELRAAVTEYQRYTTAVQTFRDKYFALPGDMTNATQFWLRLVSDATCVTNSSAAVSATNGVCDGNGDGSLGWASAAGKTGENYQFWRELALAGIIEGSYTGITVTGTVDSLAGINVPKSKLGQAAWGTETLQNFSGDTYSYAYDYGNMFNFGITSSNSHPITATLKTDEAWNIDTKLDDGKPGSGKIVARNWDNCTTSTSRTDLTGTYDFSNTTVICALSFTKAF